MSHFYFHGLGLRTKVCFLGASTLPSRRTIRQSTKILCRNGRLRRDNRTAHVPQFGPNGISFVLVETAVV